MADRKARIASVVAATAISLACGTNYAYSAWGPEFAKRMHLSATQGNIIGAAGNMGMYMMGIPTGLLVDHTHPRWAVALGAICLASGYFPIQSAYDKGPQSMSVGLVSFCSFLTGLGSCCAFSASIKVSTVNWPDHRGTATAFPLSGFGLSAFLFATIASVFFQGNISGFLRLLAVGTFCLCIASIYFIRLLPSAQDYSSVPGDEERPLSRRSSELNKPHRAKGPAPASGKHTQNSSHSQSVNTCPAGDPSQDRNLSEESSLLDDDDDPAASAANNQSCSRTEITGFKLLSRIEFWQLFSILALLAGVGLMSINNVGHDAAALWHKYDPSKDEKFIQSRQQMHVSILSVGSFLGRISSGIGSDYIIKRLHASRFWCLVASASVSAVAQVCALMVSNPHFLFLVSSLTGMGYGALFGVFPALTADAFGINGMALNWGIMIMAPVLSANLFNICYGRIFDSNAEKGLECTKGLGCYRDAYWITLASSIAGMVLALWCIKFETRKKARLRPHGRNA